MVYGSPSQPCVVIADLHLWLSLGRVTRLKLHGNN